MVSIGQDVKSCMKGEWDPQVAVVLAGDPWQQYNLCQISLPRRDYVASGADTTLRRDRGPMAEW